MKPIHPKPFPLIVIDTKGESHTINVYQKPMRDVIHLDFDLYNHKAWNKGKKNVVKGEELNKFKSKYSGLDL